MEYEDKARDLYEYDLTVKATSYIITVERVEPGDWESGTVSNGHAVTHRVDPAMSMRDLRKVLHSALDTALDAAGPPNG